MDQIDELYEKLNTGDIILFHGINCWYSYVIEYFTQSKWSHVGIILKDPTFINPNLKGLYLLESGSEPYDDVILHEHIYGVQIVNLKRKLKDYEGSIAWRKLNTTIDTKILENRLKVAINTVYAKHYDLNLIDLLATTLKVDQHYYKSIDLEQTKKHKDMLEESSSSGGLSLTHKIWNYFGYDSRKTDALVCSTLAAYIYTEMGFLPYDTQWSFFSPGDFSSKSNIKYQNAILDDEIYIKQ